MDEICRIIHENGGQVYMDGANMNAQVRGRRGWREGERWEGSVLRIHMCISHPRECFATW